MMIDKHNLLLRSMLFVPTYKESFIKHGIQSKADAIILDLEDSIPEQFKPQARQNIKNFLFEGQFKDIKTFVRINPIESKLVFEDFNYILHPDIDGFMLTKIYTSEDMIYFDKLITQLENENNIPENHYCFVPLIETTSAVMDIYNIARASKRTIALAFGGEDFLNDLEGLHGEPPISFDYPRAAIAIASRACGLKPIDTPYLSLNDFEGFKKEESISFEMGFAGCLLIHPKQVELANICFSPSESEVKKSQEIVAAVEKSKAEGSGVAMFGEKMIGPPMEKRARKVLAMMDLINNNNSNG